MVHSPEMEIQPEPVSLWGDTPQRGKEDGKPILPAFPSSLSRISECQAKLHLDHLPPKVCMWKPGSQYVSIEMLEPMKGGA